MLEPYNVSLGKTPDEEQEIQEFAGFTPITTRVREVQDLCPNSTKVGVDDPPCGEGTRTSRCITLRVYLPLSAQVNAIFLFCKEEHDQDWIPCQPGERPLGWSRFMQPWEELTPGNRVVAVTFKNWSHDRKRRARLMVDYSISASA